MVMPSAKTNTGPATLMAPTRGRPGGLSATSARTPNSATTIPRAPPSAASSKLSVSSCRIIRVRPAPSAARIANSPRRCAPRASSRFVTFTHAIRSTRITAPRTASNAGLTPRVTSSCSEAAMNLTPRPYVSGCCSSNTACPSASTSRVASSALTPGRSRPTVRR